MIHWRHGEVTAERTEWPGAREVYVRLDTPLPHTDTVDVRALAYTELVGSPQIGDTVVLNVSALARGLGTGGFGLVVAIPGRLPADPAPGPGHMVKARYTPLQTMVMGVDEQESPHHEVLKEARGIAGLPVLVADLHSALPAVLAGIRSRRPEARVCYVMTDGAALPLTFSRAVAGLQEAGWLDSTITVGQAYGGDHEAVTVHSALLAARTVAQADLVLVSQGPGNLGTGTRYGFSGLVCGDHLAAAAGLGGLPVAVARMSNADARGRHFGISHHTTTVLNEVTPVPVDVPLPDFSTVEDSVPVAEALAAFATDPRPAEQERLLSGHRLHRVDVSGLWAEMENSPVRLSTMGRGLQEDPVSFYAAAAAGRWAAELS